MYSKFHNLKSDKQKLIMNAAIKEFVSSGFDKASTNEIVKRANISKGSLFNYFNSKKDLYIYLLNDGIRIIRCLYEEVDFNEGDLFKRIEKIGIQKLHIQRKYPQVFDFLSSVYMEESEEVQDIIKQKVEPIYEEGTTLIYKDIDYSLFHDEVNIEKAIEILNWTMFGYGKKSMHQLNTFKDMAEFGEMYLKEWKEYTVILKRSFYK